MSLNFTSFVFLFISSLFTFTFSLAKSEVQVGEVFPAFRLKQVQLKTDSSDATIQNSVFNNKKITVIDFWASWCEPCKVELPFLANLEQKYKHKGLQLIAINVDDDLKDAQSFLQKYAPSVTCVYDQNKKVIEFLNVSTMPTTFIVNKDGKVLQIRRGFHLSEKESFTKDIEKLL